MKPCLNCHGTGFHTNRQQTRVFDCPDCNGLGVQRPYRDITTNPTPEPPQPLWPSWVDVLLVLIGSLCLIAAALNAAVIVLGEGSPLNTVAGVTAFLAGSWCLWAMYRREH